MNLLLTNLSPGGKVIHGLPSGMDASVSLLSVHNSTGGQSNGDNGTTIKAEYWFFQSSDQGQNR